MITTFIAATIAGSTNLSKAEMAMVLALRDRNVAAVRKLMTGQISLFTVISGKEAKITSELPENYLVGSARFEKDDSDDDIKINLERISRLIARSLAKPTYQPKVLKSLHNDLTKHTIRGMIAPQVVWELHYDVRKDHTLRLQRICEFDHSPKFVW